MTVGSLVKIRSSETYLYELNSSTLKLHGLGKYVVDLSNTPCLVLHIMSADEIRMRNPFFAMHCDMCHIIAPDDCHYLLHTWDLVLL